MSQIKFHKVYSLPVPLEENSVYFVLNDTFVETYVTDSDGDAVGAGNSEMINELIAAQLGAINQLQKVATIAARNALTLTKNSMVLVADATADNSVTAGAALYFYDFATTTFSKVAEYESMDVQTAWASITGRPNSAVADIEDAVSKRHSHTNKSTLDKLGENSDGLVFDGSNVSAVWTTNNW